MAHSGAATPLREEERVMKITIDHGAGYDTVDKKTKGALTTALNYVRNVYENLFTNDVNMTIHVRFADLGAPAADGSVTVANNNGGGWENGFFGYQRVRSALIGNETSLLQQTAYANLPRTDPTGQNRFSL